MNDEQRPASKTFDWTCDCCGRILPPADPALAVGVGGGAVLWLCPNCGGPTPTTRVLNKSVPAKSPPAEPVADTPDSPEEQHPWT
jgi:hypothetical protein